MTISTSPTRNSGASDPRIHGTGVAPLTLLRVAAFIDGFVLFLTGIATSMTVAEDFQPDTPTGVQVFAICIIGSSLFYAASTQLRTHFLGRPMADYLARNMLRLAIVFCSLTSFLLIFRGTLGSYEAWLIRWSAMSFFFVLAAQIIFWKFEKYLLATGKLRCRVAIYGLGDIDADIGKLLLRQSTEITSVGFYNDDCSQAHSSIPNSGGLSKLIDDAIAGEWDRIAIFLPLDNQNRKVFSSEFRFLPIDVEYCVKYNGAAAVRPTLVSWIQECRLGEVQRLVKSASDFILALLAIIMLSPLLLLIAIAIKLDSAGPVFFVQPRHGINMRTIRMLKFRTMTVQEIGDSFTQATRNDKRVTRVGRFLRKTSLDELPQLINVLRGDLSLVGPRPHMISHDAAFAPLIKNYYIRYMVKPGITGWAQVNGLRGETADLSLMKDRVEHDLWYIYNWSFWLDLRILIKSLKVPFFDPNAY